MFSKIMIKELVKLFFVLTITTQSSALNVVSQRKPTKLNIISPSEDYFTNKDPERRSDFCERHNATCSNANESTCKTCKCNDELIWMSFEENGCRSRMYLDGIVNGVCIKFRLESRSLHLLYF